MVALFAYSSILCPPIAVFAIPLASKNKCAHVSLAVIIKIGYGMCATAPPHHRHDAAGGVIRTMVIMCSSILEITRHTVGAQTSAGHRREC